MSVVKSTLEMVDGSNPKKLIPFASLFGMEAGCAIVAAGMVAPLITIIDQSIFSNASGKEPMAQCIKNNLKTLFTQPTKIFRSVQFRWIWFVYSGTYIVANSIETFCTRNDIDWYYPKFVGSSITNVGLSLVKDKAFARMFGVVKPKPLPAASYALFATRDSLTIGASFNLPPKVSMMMQEHYGYSKVFSDTSAQLIIPCAAQLLSSPLHLLGMDLYNQPSNNISGRCRFIVKEYLKTTAARIGRIFPAFGIGGVANKSLRNAGNGFLTKWYLPFQWILLKILYNQ